MARKQVDGQVVRDSATRHRLSTTRGEISSSMHDMESELPNMGVHLIYSLGTKFDVGNAYSAGAI